MAIEDPTPEEWRSVVGYEGVYEVSSLGRVRRIKRTTNPRHFGLLRGSPNNNGYPCVDLCDSGRRSGRQVHQLVAAAFIGPCPDGMEVNHKNGQKTDNRLENLEYLTPKENVHHAYRELDCTSTRSRGEDHYAARLTEELVREARRRSSEGESCAAIARAFGVKQAAVWDAVNRRSWAHVE